MSFYLGQDYPVLDRLHHKRNMYAAQIYYTAVGYFSKGQALLNAKAFHYGYRK